MKEICLTAHHEGGFALWPSKFTDYSVARSLHWHGGRGDVLRAFADAANRAGINICYYINTPSDSYEANVANRSAEAFTASQVRPLGCGVRRLACDTLRLINARRRLVGALARHAARGPARLRAREPHLVRSTAPKMPHLPVTRSC